MNTLTPKHAFPRPPDREFDAVFTPPGVWGESRCRCRAWQRGDRWVVLLDDYSLNNPGISLYLGFGRFAGYVARRLGDPPPETISWFLQNRSGEILTVHILHDPANGLLYRDGKLVRSPYHDAAYRNHGGSQSLNREIGNEKN